MSNEEKAEVREQVKVFRQYEQLIRKGDYYRLSSPYEGICTAWAFVSEDQEEVLLNAVWHEVESNQEAGYIRLKGLKADGVYKDMTTNQTYFGDVLMEVGLVLPQMEEYDAYQAHFVLV